MEKSKQCEFKSEYISRRKDKVVNVVRVCPETVVLRRGLGNFLTGTCTKGHINGEKITNK